MSNTPIDDSHRLGVNSTCGPQRTTNLCNPSLDLITGTRFVGAGSLLRESLLDDADDRHQYAATDAATGNAADDAADVHFAGSGGDPQHSQ